MEWWDVVFLPNKSYLDLSESALNTELVTMYIQHPVPIPPPADLTAQVAPKPLMLTTKERKKLRRQRRAEVLREKQDKIRLGLLPEEQPKVRISNLMRVLGTEAVLDPTKIEATVRQQMELRQAAHTAHNEGQKLSGEARKQKNMRKFLDGPGSPIIVSVFKYVSVKPSVQSLIKFFFHRTSRLTKPLSLRVCVCRITDLSSIQRRFKIDINAQQLHMTGCMILYKNTNMVVVEGGPKSVKFFKKLLLRRIDWSGERGVWEEEADDDDDIINIKNNHNPIPTGPVVSTDPFNAAPSSADPSIPTGPKVPAECILVWEGQVEKRAFWAWKSKTVATERMMKEFFEKACCSGMVDSASQYYSLCKNWSTDI